MKKIIVFLVSFFFCLTNAFALGKIENITSTVTIDSKGDATVVE